MASARFYCPIDLTANSRIELPPDVAHHASRVLRLDDGSPIRLFNGKGGCYSATLHINGKTVLASIDGFCPEEIELEGRITLVQGLASGDKMDWIIEKAVELGVNEFQPIAARRSVLQLGGERLAKRMVHWQRIIQSASEQCGRNRLMQLNVPTTLEQYLKGSPGNEQTLRLFCHPEAGITLSQALTAGTKAVTFLVGPEGGWAPEEQRLVSETNMQAVQFGRRVLRTETAGLALVAACTALMGWQ